MVHIFFCFVLIIKGVRDGDEGTLDGGVDVDDV